MIAAVSQLYVWIGIIFFKTDHTQKTRTVQQFYTTITTFSAWKRLECDFFLFHLEVTKKHARKD